MKTGEKGFIAWKIKNIGKYCWNKHVKLVIIKGDKSFVTGYHIPNANPNECVWITLNFKCFDIPGIYSKNVYFM